MIDIEVGTELRLDEVADRLTEPWKPVDLRRVNDTAGPAIALLVERADTKQYGGEAS